MSFMVKNCCFCVELRTGTLIMGYLHLAANILLPFITIYELSTDQILRDWFASEVKLPTLVVICLLFALILLGLVLNIFFLVGIQKNKPDYVNGYVIFLWMAVILTFIALINDTVKGACHPPLQHSEIVKLYLKIVVLIYSLLVFRSYHSKMLTPERGPAIMGKV